MLDTIMEQARVELLARERIAGSRNEISSTIDALERNDPRAAEPDYERRVAAIVRNAGLSETDAEMAAVAAAEPPKKRKAARESMPEAIQGGSAEFLPVHYLGRGQTAARSVGRVVTRTGHAVGSGVLVAPGLFLTNNHVISDPSNAQLCALELDYEVGLDGNLKTPIRFEFDVAAGFAMSPVDALDYTLVAVGPPLGPGGDVRHFGYLPLLDLPDKHSLGEVANIVQHPLGRFKELVIHNNRIVARDNMQVALHYVADTEQGSSGSPVFNNDWEIIALHHWAGPFREITGLDGLPLMRTINEGIRISRIVQDIRGGSVRVLSQSGDFLADAYELWQHHVETGTRFPRGGESVPVSPGGPAPAEAAAKPAGQPGLRPDGQGGYLLTLPLSLDIDVSIGGQPAGSAVAAPAIASHVAKPSEDGAERVAAWKTEDFSDRGGYEPGFLPGHIVPMPALKKVPGRAAVNQIPNTGAEDREEFPYHHFSVKLNAERGLCYFTACNIAGGQLVHVNRSKKEVDRDPTLGSFGAERLTSTAQEQDAGFMPDRRVLPGEQMTNDFYEDQVVAGHPDPRSTARIRRIFQRGHIVLRSDPTWGHDAVALAAERDTHFFPNICPQVGWFNQGLSPDIQSPGFRGKFHWREVETYVLRNAFTRRQRVSVFAGPVFADDDPDYRFGAKVPMKFWKVAAWVDENDDLRSIALIADQKPLIEVMPESLARPENFTDPEELERVSQFLTTVGEIEDLTGLDFGAAMRRADVRSGEGGGAVAAADLTMESLHVPKRRRRSSARSRRKTARK